MIEGPIFEIRGAKKLYSGAVALQVDHLTIQLGDRIFVSGQNGSGKSTLLRVLAGLVDVDEGQVWRGPAWRQLLTGYLPQDGGSYGDLSIFENQRVYQRLFGRRDVSRAKAILERFELTPFLHKQVGELSGGLKRLATIFCLLSCGTDALILDEPWASLDAEKQLAVADVFVQVASEYSVIIVSEHAKIAIRPGLPTFWSQDVYLTKTDNVVAT